MKANRFVCLFLLLAILAAAGSAQVSWTVYPDPVPLDQSVLLKIENRLRCTIYLPSSAPWAIHDSNGKLVYSPLSTPVVVPVKPLGHEAWTWDQSGRMSARVPHGTYEARITYLDCRQQKTLLRTKFKIENVMLKVSHKTAPPGARITYNLQAPTSTGSLYQAACSLGDRPGIPLVGNRLLRLNADWLFLMSILFPSPVFENFSGVTSKSGHATSHVNIPRHKALIGMKFYMAYMTFRLGAPGNIHVHSTSKEVLIK